MAMRGRAYVIRPYKIHWANDLKRGDEMRVLKIDELKETPMDTATPIAGWTGGA